MVVLNIMHVLIAIAMVALVLVQRGTGATAGAAFGSGASGTVFGSRGAGNFLTKSTWVLATLFCAISLFMAVMVSRGGQEVDTDLGVVTSTPSQVSVPAEEVPVVTEEQNGSVSDGTEQQLDLPSLQVSEEDVTDATGLQQQTSEDLPQLDGESVESVESGLEEANEDTRSNDS